MVSTARRQSQPVEGTEGIAGATGYGLGLEEDMFPKELQVIARSCADNGGPIEMPAELVGALAGKPPRRW